MKRTSLLLTLLAVIALSASVAYWGLQLFKPQPRPQVAVPKAAMSEPSIEAAAGLFGGQAVAATNYQLKGVLAAVPARDGVAIVAADGKPAQAYKVGQEISPGVVIKEVQQRFIMLSEGGVAKRIDLPAESKGANSGAQGGNPAPQQQQAAPPPAQPSIPVPPPPPAMNQAPTIVTPPTQ